MWPRVQHWPVVPIAIDWTFCEKHERWQSLVASIMVRGRGIPILVWSFRRHGCKKYGSPSKVEDAFIRKLKSMIPESPGRPQTIVIIADRGFARAGLFNLIRQQGFHYCIRIKKSVYAWPDDGDLLYLWCENVEPGDCLEWQDVDYPFTRTVKLKRLVATCAPPKVGKEKDPWFLASSLPWSANRLIDLYAKRMVIEEDFKTAKTDLSWKHYRIRKLTHYRRFVLLMVACLVFSMLLGISAQRKPSLVSHVVRTRKKTWDSCLTRIGLLLLRYDMAHINYLKLMCRLPA